MKFQEITEKEYREFWEKHPLKTFLSAPEIGKLRENAGWTIYYVGVKEGKKLLASTMLMSHKRHFGKEEFYSPRGFLLDFKNQELLDYFTSEVKKYVKEKNGYILRIDPYIIYKERDIDGNIVEGGVDNTDITEHLKQLGFRKVSIPETEQVIWMFSLDLEGKTEESLLKEMRQNTRNTIRKTEKIGINVKEISYEELERFHNIMIETSERKGFSNRKISYYQEMYKLFHDKGEVKFYITELNLKDYIKRQKEEIKEKQERLEKIKGAGERKNIETDINTLEKRIEEAESIRKEKQTDTITLSGSMFMLIQPEVVYLSSGNYEEFMKYNSQYLIQWELIKLGLQNGFKKHNFYGIPANINEHPKDYGIYEFKKGFNGYVEELIGEWELPISWQYYLMKMIHKIKGGK